MPAKKKTSKTAGRSGKKAAAKKKAVVKKAKKATAKKKPAAAKKSPVKPKARPAAKPKAKVAAKPKTRPAAPAPAKAASPSAKPGASAAKPSASSLKLGAPAPEFALEDQTGRTIRLSDFRGRKLLIYFYPKADTPGCSVQSCSVRDARKDLTSLGVEVLGISPDLPNAQAKFDQKYGLGFPLLSDPDHVAASAYGAWGQKSMYGKAYMGIIRSAFLVGEDGKLLGAWSPVKPDETVPNARAVVAAGR